MCIYIYTHTHKDPFFSPFTQELPLGMLRSKRLCPDFIGPLIQGYQVEVFSLDLPGFLRVSSGCST